MYLLDDITVRNPQEENKIISVLQKSGAAVIPGYLERAQIEKLIGEFHFCLSSAKNNFVTPFDYSEGSGCVVANDKIDKSILPETFKVFNSSFMKSLALKYLGGYYALNSVIYFVKDVVGSKHLANDLHFDVNRAFKFFIYLNDASVKNGAFACVPGSHLRALEIREKLGNKINFDNRELTRELPYTDKDAQAMEGKAGTLIIFDTNVFHRAGNVSEGERWVMRGHTYITAEKNKASNVFSKIKSLFK